MSRKRSNYACIRDRVRRRLQRAEGSTARRRAPSGSRSWSARWIRHADTRLRDARLGLVARLATQPSHALTPLTPNPVTISVTDPQSITIMTTLPGPTDNSYGLGPQETRSIPMRSGRSQLAPGDVLGQRGDHARARDPRSPRRVSDSGRSADGATRAEKRPPPAG